MGAYAVSVEISTTRKRFQERFSIKMRACGYSALVLSVGTVKADVDFVTSSALSLSFTCKACIHNGCNCFTSCDDIPGSSSSSQMVEAPSSTAEDTRPSTHSSSHVAEASSNQLAAASTTIENRTQVFLLYQPAMYSAYRLIQTF